MDISNKRQAGGSLISTIITLAILGYAILVGIQYVPQMLESKAIGSILDRMRDTQVTDPVSTINEAHIKVIKMLQINEMNNMTKAFRVDNQDSGILITFDYDRDLNLIFKTIPIHYKKTMHLRI